MREHGSSRNRTKENKMLHTLLVNCHHVTHCFPQCHHFAWQCHHHLTHCWEPCRQVIKHCVKVVTCR